jgi:hypothetical protein
VHQEITSFFGMPPRVGFVLEKCQTKPNENDHPRDVANLLPSPKHDYLLAGIRELPSSALQRLNRGFMLIKRLAQVAASTLPYRPRGLFLLKEVTIRLLHSRANARTTSGQRG